MAFIGVLLSHLLNVPELDGAASVVIGLILVSAAIWLAAESRSLLVGEVADPEIVAALRDAALSDPAVDGPRRSAHHAPRARSRCCSTSRSPSGSGIPVEEVDAAIRRIEQRIQLTYPQVTHIFVEVRNRQTP